MTALKQEESTRADKIKTAIFLVILFTLLFTFVDWLKRRDDARGAEHYQPMAIAAMQKECAKSCSLYGLSQTDLIGPKLEYANSGRNMGSYFYSWNAKNAAVKLTVHAYYSMSDNLGNQFDVKWVSSK